MSQFDNYGKIVMRVADWEGEVFRILDVNCIILAGGKSARLGRNKLIEKVGGRNLLERVINRLTCFGGEIIIVTGQDSVLPDLNRYSGIKTINDIIHGKGSLGGLYSGLSVSDNQYNLVAACDMPFLNLDLLKHMIDLANNYDAIVPMIKEYIEPLHAIYSKKCLPVIYSLMKENRLSISELFSLINVRYVTAGEIDKYDPYHLSFFNINNEADLKAARELAALEETNID